MGTACNEENIVREKEIKEDTSFKFKKSSNLDENSKKGKSSSNEGNKIQKICIKSNLNISKNQNELKNERIIETLKITLNTNLPSPIKWNEEKICTFGYHKALLGYLNAYFDHCPIKVSPNIIWQLILNAFSMYVNDNSEYLRRKFVNFSGKKDLIFVRIGTFEDLHQYEEGIIEEYCENISEYIGSELNDILTPNFSTSTKDTIIAGKVSVMSTFQKYFRYMGDFCSCGIPYIILEGTLKDWEKILTKLDFLSKYKFYVKKMKKNIIEIINTKKGNINYDFWRNIIMETKETVEEVVDCMDKKVEKDVIKGWICDFYRGKEYLERNNLVDEVLKAPVQLRQIETKEMKKAIIYTGIRDLKQDPETFVVEPIVNYCFSLNDFEEHSIFEEEEEEW